MLRLLALLFCLLPAAAYAADGAQLRAIGYSPDGRTFAFEQYGVQDGSGFPYSEIYVIDIPKDAWVKGTPVRVVDENEEGKIADARAKAMAQVAPVLTGLKIASSYDTLVHMPFTEIISDRHKVRFARYYDSMANTENYNATGSYELSVKDIDVPQIDGCPDADISPIHGMELTIKNVNTGNTKTIARDTAIPKSRYCPSSYDLEAVFAPSDYGMQPEYLVAIIGVYSRGFEGQDRRFLAVPFELFE